VLKGRADEALYAAKRAGRDRVRVWAQKDEQVEMTVLI
jgi:PleD family two-component response regulator